VPPPKVEFEVEAKMPLKTRNTALDFTDRWRGFEADVFRLIGKLTGTPWRLTRVRIKVQSTSAPEPENDSSRAIIQLDAGANWTTREYLRAVVRELLLSNTREKLRRQLKTPFDDAIHILLADLYSSQLLTPLIPGSAADIRPSIAHFLSTLLPAHYPQMNKEKLLEESARVRATAEATLNEFSAASGRFYEAFLQLRDQLKEQLENQLAPDL
jgi:hypothetical protein